MGEQLLRCRLLVSLLLLSALTNCQNIGYPSSTGTLPQKEASDINTSRRIRKDFVNQGDIKVVKDLKSFYRSSPFLHGYTPSYNNYLPDENGNTRDTEEDLAEERIYLASLAESSGSSGSSPREEGQPEVEEDRPIREGIFEEAGLEELFEEANFQELPSTTSPHPLDDFDPGDDMSRRGRQVDLAAHLAKRNAEKRKQPMAFSSQPIDARPIQQVAPSIPPVAPSVPRQASPPAPAVGPPQKRPRTSPTAASELVRGVCLADGSAITLESSVRENPEVAFHLTQAFNLPRDLEVAKGLNDQQLFHEALQFSALTSQLIHQSALRVSQSKGEAARALSKAVEMQKKLLETESTVRTLSAEREMLLAAKSEVEKQLKASEESLADAFRALEESKAETKDLVEKALKEGGDQGFQEGYNQATEDYTDQLALLRDVHFADGWKQALGAPRVPDASELYTSIPYPSKSDAADALVAEEDDDSVLEEDPAGRSKDGEGPSRQEGGVEGATNTAIASTGVTPDLPPPEVQAQASAAQPTGSAAPPPQTENAAAPPAQTENAAAPPAAENIVAPPEQVDSGTTENTEAVTVD